jgi:hypothetical protein
MILTTGEADSRRFAAAGLGISFLGPFPMPHELDNLYAERPIYVISTGTSLRGFEFGRLDGEITIGINRVIEHYRPTIFHCVDVTAHRTHARALLHFEGMIIAGPGAATSETRAKVFVVGRNIATFEISDGRTTKDPTVGRSFSEGLFGGGAGCTGLHTAILLGGNPIYLLGYDYYEDNGRYFDQYDESLNNKTLYDLHYEGVVHLSRQDWVPRIYCCNPRSRLKCFPYVAIDDALKNRPCKELSEPSAR